MAGLLVHGGAVYTPFRVITDGAVLVEGSHITAVGPRQDVTSAAEWTGTTEQFDAQDGIIAPGFIDLQVNGAGGKLLIEEPTLDAVLTMAATLARYGCTAFLPTVISARVDRMIAGLSAVHQASQRPIVGARILGAHLEGPFINPDRAGVHRRGFVRQPSVEEFRRFQEGSSGSIRLLTIAPELPGAAEVIMEAQRDGITLAIGHTNAGQAQVAEATTLGARLVTHLFNAMGPLGSREPGTVGATLASDELYASIIADGVHVHPASLKVAVRAKGTSHSVLVTDAMSPVGTDLLRFPLYDAVVEVRDGACYTQDGILAGSILTMNRAVRNIGQLAGVPLLDALTMATINPARVIGVDQRKGSLEEGKDADLVVCDRSLNISLAVAEGKWSIGLLGGNHRAGVARMKTGISYFGNRIPRHFQEHDLPDIVASGCSYVLHTFSENDLRFFRGSLQEMVELTHRAGLEAYLDPWGVGGLFGGEAFSDFLLQHPDCWQVKGNGTLVPMACPRAASFQAFLREWVDAAIDLGADVIFWDEPHLYMPESIDTEPENWTCRCASCQATFWERYGRPMPLRFCPEVADFREDTIVGFLEMMCTYVKQSGVRNAVCLLPYEDVEHGVVHWEKVARIEGLDILGVTPFWHLWGKDLDEFVGYFARKVATLCRAYGKEPQLWLQAFLIDAGREQELSRAAEVSWESGVRNIAAWGFEGCGHMTAIRPERPEVVWRVLGDTFRALRSRE